MEQSDHIREGMESKTIDVVVPELDNVHQILVVDGSDVQSQVGHVAKFHSNDEKNNLEENLLNDEIIVQYKQKKKETNNNQFIGLTKEELKFYINDPKWKRIRLVIALIYIFLLILLLIGSILLVIISSRCPPSTKLVWYEKEIIYEIDLTTFRDSNGDGLGDFKGLKEKLPYLEKNQIKSILLQSSIFDGEDNQNRLKTDVNLFDIHSSIGTNEDLDDLMKIFNRKDMHLIIDLPLSSTVDSVGHYWYGSPPSPPPSKINQPCRQNNLNLACRFSKSYDRIPLDFQDPFVSKEAKSRIKRWLSEKKIDGIRVDLPIERNNSSDSYKISYRTIEQWIKMIKEIEQKSKPKLLLFDIPFDLHDLIITDQFLFNRTAHSFLLNQQQTTRINAQLLNQRIQTNHLSKPQFWKFGSKRITDQMAMLNENQLSKEMALTLTMLLGGTPIVLYGEEIRLDRKISPLMSWTPDSNSGGFSSCQSVECKRRFSSFQQNPHRTSVKREEALGGEKKDSLLNLFRYLSQLRQSSSFQFGLLQTNFDSKTNSFWFRRESSGHRGYVILLNLNSYSNELSHISLYDLSEHYIPKHIHCEYQWPQRYFSLLNDTYIDSDNLLIHSQSINIFSWTTKLIKPNIFI